LWLGIDRFRQLSAVGEIAYRHRTWSRPCLARQELDRPLYCLHSGILRWKRTAPERALRLSIYLRWRSLAGRSANTETGRAGPKPIPGDQSRISAAREPRGRND